jgi:hypothetical protein
MSFMVRYCEDHRLAWPHTEGDRCPEDHGRTPTCPVRSRDSIALVNNLGKELILHDPDCPATNSPPDGCVCHWGAGMRGGMDADYTEPTGAA